MYSLVIASFDDNDKMVGRPVIITSGLPDDVYKYTKSFKRKRDMIMELSSFFQEYYDVNHTEGELAIIDEEFNKQPIITGLDMYLYEYAMRDSNFRKELEYHPNVSVTDQSIENIVSIITIAKIRQKLDCYFVDMSELSKKYDQDQKRRRQNSKGESYDLDPTSQAVIDSYNLGGIEDIFNNFSIDDLACLDESIQKKIGVWKSP